MSSRTCWRFNIDESQQQAISAVANQLGNRAIVCYAAPAFHRIAELNAHTVRGTVVAQSTFPLAARLNGHASFYYCAPGGSGIANPDPEHIDGSGLEDLLIKSGADAKTGPDETITTQLQALSRDIEKVVLDQVPDSNPRKPIFVQRLREIEAFADEYEETGDSGRAFLRITAFTSTFNLDWYAVGNPA